MPILAEILLSLRGAWLILLNRPDGLSYFDVSTRGFWRSFLSLPIAAFIAILAALWAVAPVEPLQPESDGGSGWLAAIAVLALAWVAFPFLVGSFADQIGIRQNYIRYIIARNWSFAILVVVESIAAVSLSLFGENALLIMSAVILVVTIRFGFLVARHAADVPSGTAFGLAIGDYVLRIFINLVALQLFFA